MLKQLPFFFFSFSIIQQLQFLKWCVVMILEQSNCQYSVNVASGNFFVCCCRNVIICNSYILHFNETTYNIVWYHVPADHVSLSQPSPFSYTSHASLVKLIGFSFFPLKNIKQLQLNLNRKNSNSCNFSLLPTLNSNASD